jgi:hypothetical protein
MATGEKLMIGEAQILEMRQVPLWAADDLPACTVGMTCCCASKRRVQMITLSFKPKIWSIPGRLRAHITPATLRRLLSMLLRKVRTHPDTECDDTGEEDGECQVVTARNSSDAKQDVTNGEIKVCP